MHVIAKSTKFALLALGLIQVDYHGEQDSLDITHYYWLFPCFILRLGRRCESRSAFADLQVKKIK